MGYSFPLAARVLLYAVSHRWDNTYHGLCYTSCGALAGTINRSMGPSWRIDPMTHHTMSERSYHRLTSRFYLMKYSIHCISWIIWITSANLKPNQPYWNFNCPPTTKNKLKLKTSKIVFYLNHLNQLLQTPSSRNIFPAVLWYCWQLAVWLEHPWPDWSRNRPFVNVHQCRVHP